MSRFAQDTVTVTALLGVLLGLCIGVAATDYYHTHRPPATATLRELCVELATQSQYPTLYIDGWGCVMLINEQSKRRQS